MKSALCLGFACFLGLVVSCSDSDSADPAPSADAPKIGTRGGTVTKGKASVVIPEGALSAAVAIAVAPSDVSVAAPDGYSLVGTPIAFTPHGTTFKAAVTLTLPYSSSSDKLAVLRLDDEDDTSWELVDGGSYANGLAKVEVTTFSIYAVGAEAAADGSGGAGGMNSAGGAGGAETAAGGAELAAGGAETAAGGAATVSGDLIFSCDRADTDGNGLRICSDYFYPKLVVELAQITPSCPGAGNGVLGEHCDTSDAVAGCFVQDADGIPGLTVTNWFYSGTKADITDGVLCQEANTTIIDPP
jgi:hypothetical protein